MPQPVEATLALGHWSRIPDKGRQHHRESQIAYGAVGVGTNWRRNNTGRKGKVGGGFGQWVGKRKCEK